MIWLNAKKIGITTWASFFMAEGVSAETPTRVHPFASNRAQAQAEGIIGTAQGADILIYNPALLTQKRLWIDLVHLDLSYDRKTDQSLVDDLRGINAENYLSPERIYGTVSEDGNMDLSIAAGAFEIILPYIGFASRTNISVRTRLPEANDGRYLIRSNVDAMMIGGIGLRLGRLSVGASRYEWVRTSFVSTPDETQFEQIKTALLTENFSPQTAPLGSYSEATFGGTTGHNAGATFQLSDNNPLLLSYSVWNVGGSKFDEHHNFAGHDAKKAEEVVRETAASYSIPISAPEPLAEIKNAGIVLGYGNDDIDYWSVVSEYDYQDLDGSTLDYHSAASLRLGAHVPEKDLERYSIAFGEKGYFIGGIRDIYFMGGVRPGAYHTIGISSSLHFSPRVVPNLISMTVHWYEKTYHDPEPGLARFESGVSVDAGFRLRW